MEETMRGVKTAEEEKRCAAGMQGEEAYRSIMGGGLFGVDKTESTCGNYGERIDSKPTVRQRRDRRHWEGPTIWFQSDPDMYSLRFKI
jgi:hypothetical protein